MKFTWPRTPCRSRKVGVSFYAIWHRCKRPPRNWLNRLHTAADRAVAARCDQLLRECCAAAIWSPNFYNE